MASSVARMPGDDWPGFFTPGGSHSKHLKKIHLPKLSIHSPNHHHHHHHSQLFPSPKSSKSKSPRDRHHDHDHHHDDRDDHRDDEECVSTTPSKRHHQSQKILDRWAAHQAREMVTTIERQAHEAELSALTTTTPPVSARARRFSHRREPSPTLSDMSTCSAPPVACGDVPQTAVRASSLIQMWRDLEASTPRGACWGDESEVVVVKSPMVRPAVRGRGEIEELVARMEAERRREVDLIADRRVVSQFPNRGRLQSILRLRFLRREVPAWEEIQSPSFKAKLEQSQKSPNKVPKREVLLKSEELHCRNVPATNPPSSSNSNVDPSVDSTAESSQRSEHAKEIAQSNPVEHDSDNISAKDKDKDKDEKYYQESLAPTSSSVSNNDYYENEDCLAHMAAKDNNLCQEYSDPHANLTVDSIPSQASGRDNSVDASSDTFQDNCLSGANSPCSDEQEDSRFQSLQSSWDERNLWLSSVDWQRSAESTTPFSWNGDVVPIEDLGAFPWSSDSPNSWRALINQETFENISENMDIHDLLERKRVTTSLQSDFCTKMNRLILSVLQRQGQYNFDDNFGEEFTVRPYWRQKYKLNNSEQIATASSSLVPFQYHNNSENWRDIAFTNNVSDNSADVESMAQVRTDMAQIHDEISELRKLVERCMQWQSKLHESIKIEVSNAVSQAVLGGQSTANCPSSSALKNGCSICNEAHIDSLFYRCGHMCACFKCAKDLQINGQKCPTCRSPIEDVVRVNPNS